MNRAYVVLPKRHTKLHHRLKVICTERGLSVGDVVGDMVEQYVADAEAERVQQAIALLESVQTA